VNVGLAATATLPQAVIFDMDGLMLDTELLALRAWDEAAAALGVPFDRVLALRMVGHNFRDCTAMVRTHYPFDYPVDELLVSWHATYDAVVAREGIAVKTGVHELLDWLDVNAIPRAVATSTRRERAEHKLADAGLLPRFQALVGGDEVARGKPAPDIYFEAAARLKVAATGCVVLEDSEPGVRGALAAGMRVIMIPDLIEPSADLLLQAPLVLASLLHARDHLAALAPSAKLESLP
jgi:beta-phosphoglucomutase-like phosphatase (HAD superfamily)